MQVYAVPAPAAPAEPMEFPTPELQGKEVLVHITHTGVCHSDVHTQEGHIDVGGGKTMPLTASFPAVFGHEIVGTVAAAGPDATVQPGDEKFIVFPWIGCGECQVCRDDAENLCVRGRNLSIAVPGGFAHEVHVPDEKYLIPLGDIDPAWGATLACSGVTSYSAVNKLLPVDDDAVIGVLGTGGVGLMAIAALRALGHPNILAIDVSDENLETAKSMGATLTFNSATAENPGKELLQVAGGPIAGIADFVNNGATASLALRALQKGGKLVSVGLFGGAHEYGTAPLALQAKTIQGSFVGSLGELKALVEIARTNDLPSLPITEQELGADNLNAALDALREGKSRGRTVLVAD
ncbi:alcohol dehydrogenase [Brevibacterium litoralis]|uniref:alcohol dehydrogenase n=1 Tax=Brevibacterium litoralis TaxID=3138935 RepID=UPI0032ED2A17